MAYWGAAATSRTEAETFDPNASAKDAGYQITGDDGVSHQRDEWEVANAKGTWAQRATLPCALFVSGSVPEFTHGSKKSGRSTLSFGFPAKAVAVAPATPSARSVSMGVPHADGSEDIEKAKRFFRSMITAMWNVSVAKMNDPAFKKKLGEYRAKAESEGIPAKDSKIHAMVEMFCAGWSPLRILNGAAPADLRPYIIKGYFDSGSEECPFDFSSMFADVENDPPFLFVCDMDWVEFEPLSEEEKASTKKKARRVVVRAFVKAGDTKFPIPLHISSAEDIGMHPDSPLRATDLVKVNSVMLVLSASKAGDLSWKAKANSVTLVKIGSGAPSGDKPIQTQ